MHLQKTVSVEDILEVKHAFERMAASHGIIINQYHADNGIFRVNSWVQYYQECDKPHLASYTWVDAQPTNGLSEIRIRDIQENGRAMMLYTQQKFPEAITANFWSYALIHANNSYNANLLLAPTQVLSPLQLFTRTQFQYDPKYFHPFGCPTYVLNEAL